MQEKGRAGELLDSPSQTVETKTSKSILIQSLQLKCIIYSQQIPVKGWLFIVRGDH